MMNQMMRIQFFVAALIVSSECGVLAQSPPDQTEIKLGSPGTGISASKDFGHAHAGKKAVCLFSIKNPTKVELKIVEARVSCGCLSIVRKPDVIPPESSAVFELSLDTEGRFGRQIQSATFSLAHPEYKYLRLRVSGIADGIWVGPLTLDFGTLNRGSVKSQFFQVYEAGRGPVRITNVESDSEFVKVTARDVEGARAPSDTDSRALQHVDVAWAGTDSMPIGAFRAVVRVHTTDKDYSVIELPITAHVAGSATIRPSPVVFGGVVAGDKKKRQCKILFRQPVDGKEIDFKADHPDVVCKMESSRVEEGGQQFVEVSLTLSPDADAKAGLLKGFVTGYSKDKTAVVSFPYMGFVRALKND